ncbi:lamin tail domain-containing protein [Candidatus Nanosalina sp. VS9-1]|uniref:lamin tail domain-containing protein n=1 Tax=Candidatus Nanosalina sp. VS9-1 TaxID=3388566 RepID=UPI0039E1400A
MKYAKIFAVFGALALVGAGSAVLIENFGTISGTADVEPAVKIVEVDYEAVSGVEYIELYNPANSEVTLSGWKIGDRAGNESFPDLTIASEANALILEEGANLTDREIPSYVEVSSIGHYGLANSGEEVFLKADSSLVIDSVDFTDDPCDGKVVAIDWDADSQTCMDSNYDFEGDLS